MNELDDSVELISVPNSCQQTSWHTFIYIINQAEGAGELCQIDNALDVRKPNFVIKTYTVKCIICCFGLGILSSNF